MPFFVITFWRWHQEELVAIFSDALLKAISDVFGHFLSQGVLQRFLHEFAFSILPEVQKSVTQFFQILWLTSELLEALKMRIREEIALLKAMFDVFGCSTAHLKGFAAISSRIRIFNASRCSEVNHRIWKNCVTDFWTSGRMENANSWRNRCNTPWERE